MNSILFVVIACTCKSIRILHYLIIAKLQYSRHEHMLRAHNPVYAMQTSFYDPMFTLPIVHTKPRQSKLARQRKFAKWIRVSCTVVCVMCII